MVKKLLDATSAIQEKKWALSVGFLMESLVGYKWDELPYDIYFTRQREPEDEIVSDITLTTDEKKFWSAIGRVHDLLKESLPFSAMEETALKVEALTALKTLFWTKIRARSKATWGKEIGIRIHENDLVIVIPPKKLTAEEAILKLFGSFLKPNK